MQTKVRKRSLLYVREPRVTGAGLHDLIEIVGRVASIGVTVPSDGRRTARDDSTNPIPDFQVYEYRRSTDSGL
jgi:hypothetical protein